MDRWCLRQGSQPRPLNENHLHARLSVREMRKICLRRGGKTAEDGPKGAHLFFYTPPYLSTSMCSGEAWGMGRGLCPQEAHHCLTKTTNTQLPVWLLLRQSWGVRLVFVFIVFSSSNFRKCTTLFVRWPKCKCPKKWYCCLSQCFFSSFK